MKKFRFYRIEHRVYKDGPYQCRGRFVMELWAKREGRQRMSSVMHPIPYNDECLINNASQFFDPCEYVYGFDSISQLIEWFYDSETLKELEKADFQLSIYEVPFTKGLSGSKQAVILKDAHIEQNLIQTRSLLAFCVPQQY